MTLILGYFWESEICQKPWFLPGSSPFTTDFGIVSMEDGLKTHGFACVFARNHEKTIGFGTVSVEDGLKNHGFACVLAKTHQEYRSFCLFLVQFYFISKTMEKHMGFHRLGLNLTLI